MTKRVIQISSYYPPHLGGQENCVQGLSTALVNRGWQVDVLTSDRGAPSGHCSEHDVSVTRLRSRDFAHTAIMPGLLLALIRKAKDRPVVHVHVGQAFTPEVTYLASLIRKFPYVVQLHIDLRPSGRVGTLLPLYRRLILRRVLRRAAAVLVLSKEYPRILEESYDYAGETTVVRNGIPEEFFESAPMERPALSRPVRLVFVGRLAGQKNVRGLIEALSRFSFGTVQLNVIGAGPEERSLRIQVAERGLHEAVTFLGPLQRQALIEQMMRADAVVVPSLYEAQPYVLLESLAAKLPIISTNVVGSRELVEGCSVLCDPTPEGIASGIERFMGMRQAEIEDMVRVGRDRAESYGWSNISADYEAVYLAHC